VVPRVTLTPENVVAALELAEKLVVEVVAVGQHHQRRIMHRGLADHPRGEEQHGETLAAALRLPDQTRTTLCLFDIGEPRKKFTSRPLPIKLV
jgi:hypothetical protein